MIIKNVITLSVFALVLQVIEGAKEDIVNQQCMACLCEGASQCNTNEGCSGGICGPFRITEPYWVDAGRPTIGQDIPGAPEAYKNCVLDTYCAATAVQGYMYTFQKDCNGDGKVDCDDFALIHLYGREGCYGQSIAPGHKFMDRYIQCKSQVAQF